MPETMRVHLFNPETGDIDPTKIVIPGSLRNSDIFTKTVKAPPLFGGKRGRPKGSKNKAKASKKRGKKRAKKAAHLVKGSPEAKAHMAAIRGKKKGKRKSKAASPSKLGESLPPEWEVAKRSRLRGWSERAIALHQRPKTAKRGRPKAAKRGRPKGKKPPHLVKGSPEAKAHMAAIRSKGKKRKATAPKAAKRGRPKSSKRKSAAKKPAALGIKAYLALFR